MRSPLHDFLFVVIVLGASLLLWMGILALIANGYGWHLLATLCAIGLLILLTETTMKEPNDSGRD